MLSEEEALYELANAVLYKAADDYRYYCKAVKNAEGYRRRVLMSKIKEIERFYTSPWGDVISRGLGEIILEKLKKEQESA